MSTLLLRLGAPLQAWGIDSRFDRVRQTGSEPSKSGVIGLLAAAQGRSREASLDDLAALRFGVREVRRGRLLCDFHTVSRHPDPRPSQNKSDYVTRRYYLSDAVFIAGLESNDEALLAELDRALHAPAYPLFLGRRSCPPTLPIALGVSDRGLEEALMSARCPEIGPEGQSGSVRLVLEERHITPTSVLVRDRPVSFSPKQRRFDLRSVSEVYEGPSEHDPFGELEG